jgi:hypothetical protein
VPGQWAAEEEQGVHHTLVGQPHGGQAGGQVVVGELSQLRQRQRGHHLVGLDDLPARQGDARRSVHHGQPPDRCGRAHHGATRLECRPQPVDDGLVAPGRVATRGHVAFAAESLPQVQSGHVPEGAAELRAEHGGEERLPHRVAVEPAQPVLGAEVVEVLAAAEPAQQQGHHAEPQPVGQADRGEPQEVRRRVERVVRTVDDHAHGGPSPADLVGETQLRQQAEELVVRRHHAVVEPFDPAVAPREEGAQAAELVTALDQRHPVPAAGEPVRGRQAADPAADDRDRCAHPGPHSAR